MNLHGIGIDIVEIERIESAISKTGQAFLDRLFTSSEQSYCSTQKFPALHYAARFAAKEAVSKALRTGIGAKLSWVEMEVRHSLLGAPEMHFFGKSKEYLSSIGISEVHVSLTHARAYAAANAIALK